jgi:flavin reductase (DIM6/NTAB) family NADH-FMN oxidoreductase RutF
MKNIGPVVGLYPTPVTVVGTEIDGVVNWLVIAHIGIIGVDKMLLSMGKVHYSNESIKANKTLSISLVNETMLVAADYVGIVSGSKVDKSGVFEYFTGELKGAPLIKNAPITMECEVVDIYETETHDNFILKPINTYVDEAVLSEDGKIDYEKAKPILFEMPNRQYFSVGKALGKCWSIGREYNK